MAYSAKVMEHFSNPHNVGEIKDADGVGEVGNPKCGDIMRQYGPDSYIGRCAAVMPGCTETTVYTVAVYFGAAGSKRARSTNPAALTAGLRADLAAGGASRLVL